MSLWKLRHYLLGSHFVCITVGYSDDIRAVRWTPNGQAYVLLYGRLTFLLDDEHRWRALTFDKAEWLSSARQTANKANSTITRSAA